MGIANGHRLARHLVGAALAILVALLVFAPPAFAEGTRDLVSNGGYRPYTERYDATTLGLQRMSVMHVYMEAGETACIGTSVANSKLYTTSDGTNSGWLFSNGAMGTSYSDAQLAYVNTGDVYIARGEYANIADAIADGKTPGKAGVTLIDLDSKATSSTPGFIYDSAQEVGGVDLAGRGAGYKVTSSNTISSSTTGYVAGVKTNANEFTAPETGIYTVVYFSSAHTGDNPVKKKATDATPFAQTQKGGTIASWDLSVYNGNTLQTGRVFTSTLFINMGGNVLSGGVSQGSLYANVYAVTDDGYQYKVDFNGMDPFGFVFFANNRGLLNTADGGSSSLYHGVRSDYPDLRDISQHGISLNATPYDSSLDKTYSLFYEKPSSEALAALGIPADPTADAGGVSDFAFTGTGGPSADEGYVGKGGTFSFKADADLSATSYEIDLDFSSVGGGTVVLGNTLLKGKTNSIAWNGRDANGKIVPSGTYSTINASIKLKGGEVHFPLLDVEQNPNGIKISRLNGTDPNSTIYFNNSTSNAGDITTPWTLAYNWEVGSQVDETSGVDSSSGAMAFTNDKTASSSKGKLLGDGDMCALDVWAHYDRSVTLDAWSFKLVDTSFTVTKAWDNAKGTPGAGNPKNVTVTLQQSSDGGATWSKVTTDDAGSAVTNPVTYDTSASATYTWTKLDPTKTYQVVEASVAGYTTTYGAVTSGTTPDGIKTFSQTVTNAYKPTTLKLAKLWNMNGSTETHPESVTLSVYTTAEKMNGTLIGNYPLDDKNKWTFTVDSLDPTLTYYVYETAVDGAPVPDPFAYTIVGQGKASGNAIDGFQSTITNAFNSGNYMSVEVFKYWTDGDTYAAYQPKSIKVGLYKDGALVTKDATDEAITNPVTLNDANSWYYIWPALVAKDAPAAGYTIKETDSNGNDLSGYSAKTDSPAFFHNFGYAGFENAYQPTSFTVNKTWESGTNASQPSSVTVQLEQSLDGGTTYTDYGTPQTLNEANGWAYTWTDLPSYAADNALVQYKAVEAAVSGYTTNQGTPAYVQEGTAVGTWLQTITNTSIETNTQLTITKTWDHGAQAEADWPASVTFQIYANDVATGDSVILTADDAATDGTWQKVVAGLPVDDASGSAIRYSVKETDVTGYAQSGGQVTGDAATGFAAAFTNTLQSTDVVVTKAWEHGTQGQASWPASVTVHLLANGSEVDEATLDADGGWKHTFADEPLYDTAGDAITYTVSEDAVSDYTATTTGDAKNGFTITNAYDKTSLAVNKVWSDGNDAAGKRPSYIRVELFANGADTGRSVILNADDSWAATFDGLDRGVAYSVVETLGSNGSYYSAAGGTVTGSDADGWSATFTNTYHDYVTPLTPSASTPAGTTSGTTTPYTGDLSASLLMIGIIAVGGAAMLGIGALLLKRSRS